MRISVVINTLNEEKNIRNAIGSVKNWVDEIIVVDMFSDDKTRDIAEECGAKVFTFQRMGYSEPARAFAVSQTTCEWVLILDADELIPAALSRELLRISRQDICDAIRIPRLNYMIGGTLKYTGWGPEQDLQLRFFRKGMIEFQAIIHKYMTIQPNCRLLSLPYRENCAIVHFNYINLHQFVEKLNRYTSIEAGHLMEKPVPPPHRWKVIFLMLREFFVRYVVRKGYKDGWRGFYLSWMMVFYRLLTYGKHQELNQGLEAESIQSFYQKITREVLQEYQ